MQCVFCVSQRKCITAKRKWILYNCTSFEACSVYRFPRQRKTKGKSVQKHFMKHYTTSPITNRRLPFFRFSTVVYTKYGASRKHIIKRLHIYRHPALAALLFISHPSHLPNLLLEPFPVHQLLLSALHYPSPSLSESPPPSTTSYIAYAPTPPRLG